MDWDEAEERLCECEEAYAAIGQPGMFVRIHVLEPLRQRYKDGERTQDLYDAILDVDL